MVTNMVLSFEKGNRFLTIHQLHLSTHPEQTCHNSSPNKDKMAEPYPDKNQQFSNYIVRVVGEITIKFISILIIFTTTFR